MKRTANLRILLADDEQIVQTIIGEYLEDSGYSVQTVSDGQEAIDCLEKDSFDLALIDLKMPKMDGLSLLKEIQNNLPLLPAVIMTGHGTMETAIETLRSGAVDFLVKPVKLFELDAVLEKAMQVNRLRQHNFTLRQTLSRMQAQLTAGREREMIGTSPAIRKVKTQIQELVDSGCMTVLITGETGSGKEVAARYIHQIASLGSTPFLAINCPALPESIFESEMFGYQKGTFTGAHADKAGYFEMADKGTLFLDEISELGSKAQASLLRVLEERRFRRLGKSREIKVTARIVAASNANLEDLMRKGAFRSDLYYRLAVFPVHLPGLRHRKEDLLPLAEHFLNQHPSRDQSCLLPFSISPFLSSALSILSSQYAKLDLLGLFFGLWTVPTLAHCASTMCSGHPSFSSGMNSSFSALFIIINKICFITPVWHCFCL